MGLHAHSGILDHEYLFFFTCTLRLGDSSRSSIVPSLRKSDIGDVLIPFPPLSEQRRIVAKIEELFAELDAAVVELERVQANLKRYRASVLKAAVTGELTADWRAKQRNLEPASKLLEHILAERRAKWEADQLAKFAAAKKEPPKNWREKYTEPTKPDTTTLPPLPQGWCWASVEEVGMVQLGRQRSPGNISKDYPTKYIRAANITEFGLDLTDVLEMEFTPTERVTFTLQMGDIVLSEASGSPDQVGKPAIWRDELRDCCFQNTVVRLRPNTIASEFLLVIFQHFYRNNIFSRLSAGVGINHLSASKFSVMTIPIPSVTEQALIVQEVESRLSDITAAEAVVAANITRAARLRQSILKEAFAGRLVPQDPNDEPASVLLERIRNTKQTATPAKTGRGKRMPKVVNEALFDVMAYAVPLSTPSGQLNRTKLQKSCYLIQTHLECDLVDSFTRNKFGPYTPELEPLEAVGIERGYFTVEQVAAGEDQFAVRFKPAVNAEEGRIAGRARLGDKADAAEKLIRLICEMSTDEAELFGTTYAVWNDMLRANQAPELTTVTSGIHDWHPDKATRFPTEAVRKQIQWMRKNGYVPTGKGKPTVPMKPKRGRKKS